MKERTERAVCYPSSIARIYQTVADMQRFHFESCPMVPHAVRETYRSLKTTRPRGMGSPQQYWIRSAVERGLCDSSSGIRLSSSSHCSSRLGGELFWKDDSSSSFSNHHRVDNKRHCSLSTSSSLHPQSYPYQDRYQYQHQHHAAVRQHFAPPSESAVSVFNNHNTSSSNSSISSHDDAADTGGVVVSLKKKQQRESALPRGAGGDGVCILPANSSSCEDANILLSLKNAAASSSSSGNSASFLSSSNDLNLSGVGGGVQV